DRNRDIGMAKVSKSDGKRPVAAIQPVFDGIASRGSADLPYMAHAEPPAVAIVRRCDPPFWAVIGRDQECIRLCRPAEGSADATVRNAFDRKRVVSQAFAQLGADFAAREIAVGA